MKIKYARERFTSYRKIGISFAFIGLFISLSFGLIDAMEGFIINSVGLGMLGSAVFMFGINFFERIKQYLSIRGDLLIKHTLFPQKIDLKDVVELKKFAGEYILRTQNKELTIDIHIIDPSSLIDLENELARFNLM